MSALNDEMASVALGDMVNSRSNTGSCSREDFTESSALGQKLEVGPRRLMP